MRSKLEFKLTQAISTPGIAIWYGMLADLRRYFHGSVGGKQ
jgi:hypothetical protein